MAGPRHGAPDAADSLRPASPRRDSLSLRPPRERGLQHDRGARPQRSHPTRSWTAAFARCARPACASEAGPQWPSSLGCPGQGSPGGALSDTQLTPPLGAEGEDPEDRDAGRGRNLEGAGERRAAGRRGPPALSGWALTVTRTTSGSSTLGPARGMPDHAARWQGCAVRLSRAVMALVSVRPARPSRPWGGRAVSLRLAALSAEGIQQCVASKPFSFASHSVKTRSICEAPM